MRALGLRMGRHLGQSAVPYSSARRGGLIAFAMTVIAPRDAAATLAERGIGFGHNA